jgi:small subunit ribosomal protein S7
MRRAKPEKREILPDIRFNSIKFRRWFSMCLKAVRKSVAIRLIYDAMDLIKTRTEKNPMDVFDGCA